MQLLDLGNQQIRYSVRKSNRAKHARLTVSTRAGLEIVVPKRFNLKKIPMIVAEKHDWIMQHLPQILAAEEAAQHELPTEIMLEATGDVWQVQYDASQRWGRRKWVEQDADMLCISADRGDVDAAVPILQDWLRYQAAAVLVPWLDDVALETGLGYTKAIIRNQKTRWGSCSRARHINLNLKLLFLPPDWVHYILVHELCHTKQMDHSARFWEIVQHHLPDGRKIDKTMRKSAMAMVPWWADII